MKNPLVKLLLLLPIAFLVGCSTWFFPHYVETRGTWTGRIKRESLSRSQPTPVMASALVLTVENGPTINILKMGLFSHTDTRAAAGSRFILVDSADRTIFSPALISKSVAVKGTVYPWKSAIDSKTGEGVGNQFWILETSMNDIRVVNAASKNANQNIPAVSKLNLLRQICHFIPEFWFPSWPRDRC